MDQDATFGVYIRPHPSEEDLPGDLNNVKVPYLPDGEVDSEYLYDSCSDIFLDPELFSGYARKLFRVLLRNVEHYNVPGSDESDSQHWQPVCRFSSKSIGMITLRSALPIWIFAIEYFDPWEHKHVELEFTKERILSYMNKKPPERIKEIIRQDAIDTRKIIVNRAEAIKQVRIKLTKALEGINNTIREDQMTTIEQLILVSAQEILQETALNQELEEKFMISQPLEYFDLSNIFVKMDVSDHIRQIAHNLVQDQELRLSSAKMYLSIKDACMGSGKS
ncbi:uncharacterized protein FA14DRAFT_5444 [Meira miltonrushii]|uniref:Uncharacterized protein n=1 Tax=Meira miltonrushii TaxID=1280837 RepID=A0A316VI25_9BASI|nr:uncharacterized protein FA14DRAFT_5444 [Meira miltonrushii]PWN36698.1 hypothetical protein FA14DRAFT_5444 [Meira miltonrushii]